jgi:MFS family permease
VEAITNDRKLDTRTAPAPDEHGRPFGPRFVTPMLMGSTLNPINSSLIATALVSIAAAMHVSVGQTAILISSLYLTSAIAQPTAGRLSEEFGPRRVFLCGIVIVFAGGLIGGFAPNLTFLVVSRVLIGLGTSAGYPSAMLLIRRRSTSVGLQSSPSNVLAALAIAGAVTLAIGPAVGGLLVGWFDWRASFLVNVPVTAVAFAMAMVWIEKDPDKVRGRSLREVSARIDVAGVVGFGAAMTALLVFLLSLPDPDWTALAISIVVWIMLVRWELRASNPFFDVRLLASNMPLSRTYLRNGLTLLGVYVILYGLTQWIEAARGLSAYEAGLALIPMGALSAITAGISARHVRLRLTLTMSAALMVVGAVATLFLTSTTPMIAFVAVTGVFGVMGGANNVANQAALDRESPPETVGTASGLLRTFGYIGSIASTTITGLAFRKHVSDTGLHNLAWVLVGIGLILLVMTALDRQLAAADQVAQARTERGSKREVAGHPAVSGSAAAAVGSAAFGGGDRRPAERDHPER